MLYFKFYKVTKFFRKPKSVVKFKTLLPLKGRKKGKLFLRREARLVELAGGGGGVGGVPTKRNHGRGILSILLRRNRPKI
jgi:hypothetical protein